MNRVISVVLTGNSTSLRSALLSSARDVDTFGKQVDDVGKRTSNVGKVIAAGFTVAAIAIATSLALAVSGAAQFEQRMRNVNSISALSEEAFAGLSSKVLDLSKELPQSANNLAEGLYEIASSGFQGAEGLAVLEKAAQAASAGLTTTQTSAKAIVGVLNAYGLAASEAGRVSDVLFQTVNLGVISFEELSQNLGDVIGMAAAAGITIEEVGAAIAAITLAGVPAAEAFTGLNNLTKSLIKPSEELATVYKALGINITRDLKDPAIGLRGVMEQLRTATGGNVEAFLALFPEIRAARAAFALAANDGENYARTTAGITDKTKTAGATMRAFNEQMKAVSAQWKVFVNGLQAGAIELGTQLLPILSDTLRAMRSLGADAMPILTAGLAALAPFFKAVVEIGGNLVDIAKQLIDNLGPLAKAIAGIVAVGVIGALNAFAEGLSALTGLLADHESVVVAAGVAYAGFFAATKISAALAALPALLGAVEVGAAKAALGVGNLAASLTTLSGAAKALGVVAAIVAVTSAVTNFTSAASDAKRARDELLATVDTSSLEGIRAGLAAIGEEARKADDQTGGGLLKQTFKATLDILPFVDTGFTKNVAKSKEMHGAWKDLSEQGENFRKNAEAVGHQTGLSRKSVEDLAKVLDVDLTKGYDASEGARTKLVQHYSDLVKATHGSGEAARKAATLSIDALQEQGAAAEELAKKVTEAFSGATDIVKGFTADVSRDKGLKTFLEENLQIARDFASDIETAAKKGLDPAIITKALQAGPAAAAPFLHAIAVDHSGNLVKLANDTERALSEINTKVVAFARLTQQAVNSVDDKKVTQLGDAMRITAEVFEKDGAKTAQAISSKLGIPLERVTEVAKEYGITLGNTTQPAAEAKGAADAFGASLAGLAPKLIENGRSLDITTAAGKRNRDAIDEVVRKALAHVEALKGQGATMDQQRAAFNRHIDDLRATLTQAGYTEEQIDTLIASLKGIEGTYRATIDVNTTEAERKIAALQAKMDELGIQARAQDFAADTKLAPSYVPGPAPSAQPVEEYEPSRGGHQVEADGGVLRFYAKGGKEKHVAQVAPAGAWRVWAEDETGGEAYIPLAQSKRGRSTDVLSAVAKDFGYRLTAMVNGGVVPPDDDSFESNSYYSGGPRPGYVQYEDGSWGREPGGSMGPPRYYGNQPSPAAQMQAGLGGNQTRILSFVSSTSSSRPYSPPRYSGAAGNRSSGGGNRGSGCNCATAEGIVAAFVNAGITVKADGRRIGELVAKEFYSMRRR